MNGASLVRPLNLTRHLRGRRTLRFDVIPLVDLFLIAAFFATGSSHLMLVPGLDMSLPQVSEMGDVGVEADIVLTVGRNELVFFRGAKIAWGDLESEMKRFLSEKGVENPVLLLKADQSLSLGQAFELMEMARRAGFERVHWAAQQENRSASEGEL